MTIGKGGTTSSKRPFKECQWDPKLNYFSSDFEHSSLFTLSHQHSVGLEQSPLWKVRNKRLDRNLAMMRLGVLATFLFVDSITPFDGQELQEMKVG